jgi:hypothetical protein
MKGKSIKKAVVKKTGVKKLNKVSMSKVKGGTGETMWDG